MGSPINDCHNSVASHGIAILGMHMLVIVRGRMPPARIQPTRVLGPITVPRCFGNINYESIRRVDKQIQREYFFAMRDFIASLMYPVVHPEGAKV